MLGHAKCKRRATMAQGGTNRAPSIARCPNRARSTGPELPPPYPPELLRAMTTAPNSGPRFRFIGADGAEDCLPTLADLAAAVRRGDVTSSTLLYDIQTSCWAPAARQVAFRDAEQSTGSSNRSSRVAEVGEQAWWRTIRGQWAVFALLSTVSLLLPIQDPTIPEARALGEKFGLVLGSLLWAWLILGWTRRTRRWAPKGALVILAICVFPRLG